MTQELLHKLLMGMSQISTLTGQSWDGQNVGNPTYENKTQQENTKERRKQFYTTF